MIKSTLLGAVLGFALAASVQADTYKPSIGWQTREGALLCPSYFRVRDGDRARAVGDHNWLAETGCIIAPGGLRLVMLDTPDIRYSEGWRARIYGFGNRESQDVYMPSTDAIIFADAGSYNSEKEAKATLAEIKRRLARRDNVYYKNTTDIPYLIIPFGPEKVKLWIGPGSRNAIQSLCLDTREDRETNQEFLARTKRESEAHRRRLQAAIDAGVPYQGNRPSDQDKAPVLGKKLPCGSPLIY